MKTLSASIVLAAVLILVGAIVLSQSRHTQTSSSADATDNAYGMANLGATPADSKASNTYLKLFVGTWRDSRETNHWMRFLPDGKVVVQDEQTNIHLGSYTMVAQSNLLVLADDGHTNSMVMVYYFPSQNEVILRSPGENREETALLFKRDNPN